MENLDRNITIHYPLEARLLKILLGITLLFLIPGLFAPLLTLKKFLLIENTFSIFSGVLELLQEGQIFLFMLITFFSIVLPFFKIGILFKLLSMKKVSNIRLDKYLSWMHLYGKWSMLDVFVVAILLVSVKLGALASVDIRYGLYFFAVAVLSTMIITTRVVKLTEAFKLQELDKNNVEPK